MCAHAGNLRKKLFRLASFSTIIITRMDSRLVISKKMVPSSQFVLILFGISWLFSSLISAVPLALADEKPKNRDHLIITEKLYAKIFEQNRDQQKAYVANVLSTYDYSTRYSLLNRTYEEIIQILQEHGPKLRENNITAAMEFPKNHTVMELMALYIENTCFFGELILHMPKISYRILKTVTGWRELVLEALRYTRTFVNIVDSKSMELLDLTEQEIDISKRLPYFINPYRDHRTAGLRTKRRKKLKLKKGPHLTKLEL
ncbi:coiled-coil domain-containing protein 134-like [Toxorhynchites rutilus septentrionalis]|uniref:coiled-coil domain-containing protein 134-like n=1 Tax=Toxorhynchites rutilus septentrionalis TaxID=329112 RepID=UPI0024785B4B|nr:coiled-coil domain-containing protein 134-like [Toxorhynchites rutilus septentrionalis]